MKQPIKNQSTNNYSQEELELLCYMLAVHGEEDPGCLHYEMAQALKRQGYNLKEAYKEGETDPEIIDLIGNNGRYWCQKSISMMENTPYDQVPLYINDRVLGVFCRWRFIIGR